MKKKKIDKYNVIVGKVSELKKNDIVYLTSDIMPLVLNFRKQKEIFDPNKFIDAIIKKIGPNGTLLLPSFNWDFCKGKKYNYSHSPPQTGSLPKIVFKRKDFKRTKHPIYSFLVWGKDKKFLCNLNNKSGYGYKSPFWYLHKFKAKQFFIGVDYKRIGFSFMHYSEEKIGTKYRFFKNFSSIYIDENRKEKVLTYKLYVKDLRKSIDCHTDPKLDNILIRKNAYFRYTINDIYFGIIDLGIAGDILEKELKLKRNFLIYTKKIAKFNKQIIKNN